MTPGEKFLLYSPPIIGLMLALGWFVADRLLDQLGVKPPA